MLRRGGGGGPGGDREASDEAETRGEGGHKVEAGVAEINNSLCSAMFGLVLSDEALRSHSSLAGSPEKLLSSYESVLPSNLTLLFFGCGFSS